MSASEVTPPKRRSWPRRLLNRLEVDRAVFYAVAARGWQFVAGPVTLVLIARYFSPPVQGYYYTFWSLIALQMFFDLSFYVVIVNVASHEWQKLQLDGDRRITGDPAALSRLVSLGRLTALWYSIAGLLFVVGVGLGGRAFFAVAKEQVPGWQSPWLVLVVLSGVVFAITPLQGLLEGCNQVVAVYRQQFIRAVLGNFVVWACIPLGASLWTPVAATVVRLVCDGYLFAVTYRRFFAAFWHRPPGPTMRWWSEVWPMQWRLGLKGIFGYFTTQFINPVIFHYHGAVAAGQMGMTWQILNALQTACASWVKTRVPRFGILVAQRDYRELDRVFFRVSWVAMRMLVVGGLLFWGFDAGLYALWPKLATRLLPPWPTAVLTLTTVLALIPDCQWTYIHAHKQSPHLLLSMASAGAAGWLIWLWGAAYGPLGTGLAMLSVTVAFSLPVWTWVWWRCRTEWHQASPGVERH
jgi:O-antigen/teichoic acid export membrane protein